MAIDDYDVVVFKILEYLYACLKAGVEPSIDKLREVAGVNDRYCASVFQGILDDELVRGKPVKAWGVGILSFIDIAITQKGVHYLAENTNMAKVRSFLGKAWPSALQVAVKASKHLNF